MAIIVHVPRVPALDSDSDLESELLFQSDWPTKVGIYFAMGDKS